MIAPTAIIRGTGITFGLDLHEAEGTNGSYHSNLNNKTLKALELIQSPAHNYDYGFIHFKGVDDAGHDKDLHRKIE